MYYEKDYIDVISIFLGKGLYKYSNDIFSRKAPGILTFVFYEKDYV